jgi:serine hydrolase
MLPGWTNSGPQHWQTLWERAHPEYRRVEQTDWNSPDRTLWLDTIDRAIRSSASPVVLVCHSVGCIAAVEWAKGADPATIQWVAGAFLVAPADTERPNCPEVLHGWRPVPLNRLPFRSVVVASCTDDSCVFSRSQQFASAWGSSLVDIGDAGHIHTAAGYGPWPEGHEMLREFIAQVT